MNVDTSSLPHRIRSAVAKAFRLAGVRLDRVRGEPKLIVVFLEGSEDASTISILLHRLDGKLIAGLLRPQRLGLDSVGANLSTYIHEGLRQNACLIVLDQETTGLEELWRRVEGSLAENGISYDIVGGGGRWRLYSCSRAERTLSLGVVVNGIEQRYEKHSIEDHLVELAIVEGLVKGSSKVMDSKRMWSEVSRDEGIRQRVYRGILDSSHTLKVFEQHVSAIRALAEGLE